MKVQPHSFGRQLWFGLVLSGILNVSWNLPADEPTSHAVLWQRLEKFTQPPAEFAGQVGSYRSPLKFADGSLAKSPDDWSRRRKEILATWHKRLGAWPTLVERPTMKRLETVEKTASSSITSMCKSRPKANWPTDTCWCRPAKDRFLRCLCRSTNR